MMPSTWRLGAGLAGLGAIITAPYFAGALVLLVLDLPFDPLTGRLAYAYWTSLELPSFAPYSGRIRVALYAGAGLPLLAWLALLWRWRARLRPVPVAPLPFDRIAPDDWLRAGSTRLPVGRLGRKQLHAADRTSVLALGPYYPELLAGFVVPALRRFSGPVLVIDMAGRTWRDTAASRPASSSSGSVVRVAPLGGVGRRWNPLTHAWQHGVPSELRLERLAVLWFPDADNNDRFLASHVRQAFGALARVCGDIRRASDEQGAPTPADVNALVNELRAGRLTLDELCALPVLSSTTARALAPWRSLDDVGKTHVLGRLRQVLGVYDAAEATRAAHGSDLASLVAICGTLYLDVPDALRDHAAPLVTAAVHEWHDALGVATADALVVFHGLDIFRPQAWLGDTSLRCRVLATARGLDTLQATYSHRADVMQQRFGLCIVQAPHEQGYAEAMSKALQRYASAGSVFPTRTPALADDLRRLDAHSQIVLGASLARPLLCRTLKPETPPQPAAALHEEGDVMPVAKPILVLLAGLAAAPAITRGMTVKPSRAPEQTTMVPATIGSHRYAFPRNMYYTQNGPDADGGVMLVVRWPSLEAYPQGVDYHSDPEDFLSHIPIDLTDGSHLSPARFLDVLNAHIEPVSKRPPERDNPARNMEHRTRNKDIYGLSPYTLDPKAYASFITTNYPGREVPDADQFPDWYIHRDSGGQLASVITCTPMRISDAVRLDGDRLVDGNEVHDRALCEHAFLIKHRRLVVSLTYPRALLPKWKFLEKFVRTLIDSAELK